MRRNVNIEKNNEWRTYFMNGITLKEANKETGIGVEKKENFKTLSSLAKS